MILREELKQNAGLKLNNGVFYQTDHSRQNDFEQIYLSLRTKENRLYTDEKVKLLPAIASDEKLKNEWSMRKISVDKLIAYLKRRHPLRSILEVGCGNGWLANKLVSDLSTDVLAIDVNEAELLQGARVFSSERLNFVYGDVFSIKLQPGRFDSIILASSIQYFQNIQSLINHLLRLVTAAGEIHIIDSPIYSSDHAVTAAKKRSAEHFADFGYRDMQQYYFHHTWEEIGIFKHKVLENPHAIMPLIRRKLFKKNHPVFPWIVIKAN